MQATVTDLEAMQMMSDEMEETLTSQNKELQKTIRMFFLYFLSPQLTSLTTCLMMILQ